MLRSRPVLASADVPIPVQHIASDGTQYVALETADRFSTVTSIVGTTDVVLDDTTTRLRNQFDQR